MLELGQVFGRGDPAGWPAAGPLDFATTAAIVADLWAAARDGGAGIERRRRRRLADLVRFARRWSPFYRELYGDLPADGWPLEALPVTTKAMLMDRFDEAVTDPRVTRERVESFVYDPAMIGRPLDGRCLVCRTSGTSGTPGLYIHDPGALAVSDALLWARGWPAFLEGAGPAAAEGPAVLIAADSGAYAAVAGWRRLEAAFPFARRAGAVLSVLEPLAAMVERLAALQPATLVAYPSILVLLAGEQRAGRLGLRPRLLVAGGERLDRHDRQAVEAAFGCPVADVYAASECDYIAFACPHGWLHVNDDWVILEPVDAAGRPVAPGRPSHTVLLTNLANRVQPIIRYDLGDSVTPRAEPCPCGSPLQAIRVAGRADDTLRLGAAAEVAISPMAITTVVEEVAGVRRFQIVQTAGSALSVRLEPQPGADRRAVWRRTRSALAAYLEAQGAGRTRLALATEPPKPERASGKLRQVIALKRRP